MDKIRVGDLVQIISGSDRPQTAEFKQQASGRVVAINRAAGTCRVEGKNLRWVHKKSRGPDNPGGREQVEKDIPLSNVMVFNEAAKRAERVGIREEEGKRVRFFKKSGTQVPEPGTSGGKGE